MRARYLLTSLALLLCTPVIAGPQPPPTNILFGFITSNRILTVAPPGPVYYVPGDVVINPGVTLTIEPGVSLEFAANRDTLEGGDYSSFAEILVKGSLVADASTGDSIRFWSTSRGPYEWGQLEIDPSGSATLRRVAIRGAHIAVTNRGILSLRNSSLSGGSYGLYSPSGGNSEVTDTELKTFSAGMYLPSGIANLLRVVISDVNDGILGYGAQGRIQQVTLVGRGQAIGTGLQSGFSMSTAAPDTTDPRPTRITAFGTGVSFCGRVDHLLVYGNASAGVNGDCGSPATVNNCTVVGNGTGINLGSCGSRVYSSIVAQNGSWGIRGSGCGCFYTNYADSWSNSGSGNFMAACEGANTASFNPFFVDPANHDYRLREGAPFKTYGPWGAEIGAYGPGPGQPVHTQAITIGRLKAAYR